MATLSVTYPSGPAFDLDYYLNTHMPLVAKYAGHLNHSFHSKEGLSH